MNDYLIIEWTEPDIYGNLESRSYRCDTPEELADRIESVVNNKNASNAWIKIIHRIKE